MGVVIVGGGQAGVQTADSLRHGGYTGSITVLAEEDELPYQRPPLSKDYLAPNGKPSPLPLRPASFFTDKNVDLRMGVNATDIDRHDKAVALSDGAIVHYDHLVLATGARNRELSCAGADLEGIHSLKTLADAQVLQTALATARNVVVVGAGFIGLEFASAARAHGCSVNVLEFAALPMGRALTSTTAKWFAASHLARGVELQLNEGIAHFEAGPDGRVAAAISNTDQRYPADLVVVGVGVIPNDDLAARAGLETRNGIVVDRTLRTSDPAILAIGDCANFPDIRTGANVRLESVQNAAAHGKHAAQTILGISAAYEEIPWFWSTQGNIRLQIAGLKGAGDKTVLLGDPDTATFSVLCYEGDRLTAVESVNSPGDHMAARKLLAAGPGPTPEEASASGFRLKQKAQQSPLSTPLKTS